MRSGSWSGQHRHRTWWAETRQRRLPIGCASQRRGEHPLLAYVCVGETLWWQLAWHDISCGGLVQALATMRRTWTCGGGDHTTSEFVARFVARAIPSGTQNHERVEAHTCISNQHCSMAAWLSKSENELHNARRERHLLDPHQQQRTRVRAVSQGTQVAVPRAAGGPSASKTLECYSQRRDWGAARSVQRQPFYEHWASPWQPGHVRSREDFATHAQGQSWMRRAEIT